MSNRYKNRLIKTFPTKDWVKNTIQYTTLTWTKLLWQAIIYPSNGKIEIKYLKKYS